MGTCKKIMTLLKKSPILFDYIQMILFCNVSKDFTRNIPNYFMYDDHEIDNDYCNGTNTELFNNSIGIWDYYLGSKNPGHLDSGN
jgi:hypothetical protein